MEQLSNILFDLGNKNVLITGGANGVGEQLVKLCLKRGANVAFVDVDVVKGKKLENELSHKVDFYACDISNLQSVRETVNTIVHRYHQINLLINNAAILHNGRFVETDFHDVIQTDLVGTMAITQAILPFMNKGDKIYNVLSTYAIEVRSNDIAYDVANAGVLMFTKSLALELKTREIAVNAMSFKAANTQMLSVIKKGTKVKEPVEIADNMLTVIEQYSNTTGSNFVLDEIKK